MGLAKPFGKKKRGGGLGGMVPTKDGDRAAKQKGEK